MIYKGSCHCGKISFDVDGEIENVMDCNCSICSKRGHVLWFVPREKLTLKTPEANLSTYKFNKKVVSHYFCSACGVGPFGEGKGPDGKSMAAVNVRCLEGVDLSKLKIIHYDGKNL